MSALRRVLVACVISTQVARAAEPPPPPAATEVPEMSELALFKLEDVIHLETALASKLEQPVREAPAILSAVTREQIQSYGWLSLNDVLYRQAGFTPAMDNDRHTVAARGLFEGWNNNHLLLLIDGVPQNDNMYGSALTSEITPLVFARTIEIIRGPGSALYGSGAMNGVIEINSRSASNFEPAAEASVRVGNRNTWMVDAFGGHEFKRLSFVVAYSHYATDGNYYQSYDGSGRTDASGALVQLKTNDARNSDYIFVKVEGVKGLRGLSLQLHYQAWQFGTTQGWLFSIPDQPESMHENREIASLSYKGAGLGGRFNQEYTVQYQRHETDWRIRFLPDSPDIGLPFGLTEVLDTEMNSVFARAQYSYNLWRDMSLLAGVENTLTVYTGDHSHSATADLNSTDPLQAAPSPGAGFYPVPTPDGSLMKLRPWFQYVLDKPIDSIAFYAQYASGRVLNRVLSATVGLRYDLMFFNFNDLASGKQLSKNFNQVSPRLGIVLFPAKPLTIKALVERAFRAPSPSELFGANTYTTAANPTQLKPEEMTTFGLAGDLSITRNFDLRANWFYEIFENQIAYSANNGNLSTNLFTHHVTGVETELLYDYELGAAGWLGGFANYSFSSLVSETIADNMMVKAIARSSQLTWAPAHAFNLGVNFIGHGFNASVQGHYQGQVARRSTDRMFGAIDTYQYRGAVTGQWFTLDARLSYRFTNWIKAGLQATNLTNTHGYLNKNNAYPFDYQIEGIRVLATVDLDLRNFSLQ